MIRAWSLLVGLALSQVALGQADSPAPAAQQHVSLWVSHSIQCSAEGATFKIMAQEHPTRAAYFNAQSKVLLDTYTTMRSTAPRDPAYRQFLSACDAYHKQLWTVVGPHTMTTMPLSEPDRASVLIVSSNVQMQLLHCQIKTVGGRLRNVPPTEVLAPVQVVATDTTVSAPVRQLAGLGATVIQLSQTLAPPVGALSHEAEYKAALTQILGIANGALGAAPVPVPPAQPAVRAIPNPLPGNGRLDAPR